MSEDSKKTLDEIKKDYQEILEALKVKAAEEEVYCVWADDIDVPMEGEEDAHNYTLTNPPHYAIVTYVQFDNVHIIGLFPNINPYDPEDQVSSIAVAPSNVSYEGIVAIWEALNEVKPAEIVDCEIIHLSNEQLATVLACELDQDQVFGFIYSGDGERNKVFDMTTSVTLVKDIDDMPEGELDAILSEQRSLLSRESG